MANTDDGSYWNSCDVHNSAYNYDSNANQKMLYRSSIWLYWFRSNYNLTNTNDGTCISVVTGCISISAINYNPLANTDDLSCIEPVYGL